MSCVCVLCCVKRQVDTMSHLNNRHNDVVCLFVCFLKPNVFTNDVFKLSLFVFFFFVLSNRVSLDG